MAMKGWDKRAIRDLLGRRSRQSLELAKVAISGYAGRTVRGSALILSVVGRHAHVMVSMYQSMTKQI